MTMDDRYDLERFVAAQDSAGTYDQATAELRRGRKTGHWIWFIFPQIAGLGQSQTSRAYAISSLAEARAYLEHPVLGPRLKECARILAGSGSGTGTGSGSDTGSGSGADPDTGSGASSRRSSAEQILGGLDAQKFRSSMTLFLRADPAEPLFARLLSQYFDGQPDAATDRLLHAQGRP
jgi:uncharacterized protein (DUF1810 family)